MCCPCEDNSFLCALVAQRAQKDQAASHWLKAQPSVPIENFEKSLVTMTEFQATFRHVHAVCMSKPLHGKFEGSEDWRQGVDAVLALHWEPIFG